MVNGILLLYYRPLTAGAPTILEHVSAIPSHSRFAVWTVNTALGFPRGLRDLDFRIIVLHYSLFGPPTVFGSWPDGLDAEFLAYMTGSRGSYKIAFFQDEHHYCQPRFALLNACEVDCVYTLLDPAHWDAVYRGHTRVRDLVHTLTGYVSDRLVERARVLARPDSERTVDVGTARAACRSTRAGAARRRSRSRKDSARGVVGRTSSSMSRSARAAASTATSGGRSWPIAGECSASRRASPCSIPAAARAPSATGSFGSIPPCPSSRSGNRPW